MKRRYLMILALVAVSATAMAWWLSNRPGVTKANFDRVQNGMELADVQFLFGSPPEEKSVTFPAATYCHWLNDNRSCTASILFDANGKVMATTWRNSNGGIGEEICRWIHWPWW